MLLWHLFSTHAIGVLFFLLLADGRSPVFVSSGHEEKMHWSLFLISGRLIIQMEILPNNEDNFPVHDLYLSFSVLLAPWRCCRASSSSSDEASFAEWAVRVITMTLTGEAVLIYMCFALGDSLRWRSFNRGDKFWRWHWLNRGVTVHRSINLRTCICKACMCTARTAIIRCVPAWNPLPPPFREHRTKQRSRCYQDTMWQRRGGKEKKKQNKKRNGKHVICGCMGISLAPGARAGTQLQDRELPILCKAPNRASPSPSRKKRGEAWKSEWERSGDFWRGDLSRTRGTGGCECEVWRCEAHCLHSKREAFFFLLFFSYFFWWKNVNVNVFDEDE